VHTRTVLIMQYEKMLKKQEMAIFGEKPFSYEEWAWAWTAARTRAFGMKSSIVGRDNDFVMFPFGDFFNVKTQSVAADWHIDRKTKTLVINSTKSYQSGDQIYVWYGNKSNSEYITSYGFWLDDNEHDYVKLDIGIDNEAPYYHQKRGLLERLQSNHENEFIVQYTGLGWPVFASWRIIACEDKKALFDENKRQALLEGKSIGLEWDYLATVVGITYMKNLLARYPSTIEHDNQLLRTTELSTNMRNIIRWRKREKEIITNMTFFLEQAKERIAAHVSENTLKRALEIEQVKFI